MLFRLLMLMLCFVSVGLQASEEPRAIIEPRENPQDTQSQEELAKRVDDEQGAAAELCLNNLLGQLQKETLANMMKLIDNRVVKYLYTRDWTGNYLQLWDGSLWNVDPCDAYIARSWYTTDRLYITTIDSDPYNQFYIFNIEDSSYVRANYYAPPYAYSPYLQYISSIDYYSGYVYLNDGTVWSVDSWDMQRLEGWLPGDVVISAVNNLSSYLYPYQLINLNVNTSYGKSVVRACFN